MTRPHQCQARPSPRPSVPDGAAGEAAVAAAPWSTCPHRGLCPSCAMVHMPTPRSLSQLHRGPHAHTEVSGPAVLPISEARLRVVTPTPTRRQRAGTHPVETENPYTCSSLNAPQSRTADLIEYLAHNERHTHTKTLDNLYCTVYTHQNCGKNRLANTKTTPRGDTD